MRHRGFTGIRLSLALVLAVVGIRCALSQEGAQALFQQAQAAQRGGQYLVAAQEYQQLTSKYPELVSAHANFGVVLVALHRYGEAITQYKIALAQAPQSPLLLMDLGLAYFKKGDFAAAAENFSSLNNKHPNDVRIATLLGTCDLALGSPNKTVMLLKPLETSNAENQDLEWVLGSALVRTGEALEGVTRIHKVAEESHSPEAYRVSAEIYLDLTLFQEAEVDARAALRLKPASAQVHFILGMLAALDGNFPKAAEHYEAALKGDPENQQARMQLANVLYKQRKFSEATANIERVISARPDAYGARYELAQIEEAEGHLQDAVKELEIAEQQNPKWIEPHVQLSSLYYKLRRPDAGSRERVRVDALREIAIENRGATQILHPQVSADVDIPLMPPSN